MGGHRRIIGAAAVLLLAACGKGPGTGAGPYGAADAATAEVPADRTGMP
ncbi:MAG: hypothetical protein FJ098_16585, partial [Deltaproteobacteria bacterium]|nr:hypothetical protein [Deltaproteobacteria bacterium]